MAYGRLIAHQIKSIANQANAGLITQQQAHDQMNRQLRGVSDADKAEAKTALNQQLRNRR